MGLSGWTQVTEGVVDVLRDVVGAKLLCAYYLSHQVVQKSSGASSQPQQRQQLGHIEPVDFVVCLYVLKVPITWPQWMVGVIGQTILSYHQP
jgi:hypothetical protein